MTRPRVPLLALAAGLLLPGLGQVYAGHPARGLGVLLGVAVLPIVTAWLALMGPSPALWLVVLAGVLAGVGVYAWSVVDAWRLARRNPGPVAPWQRPLVYVLCVVVAYLFVLLPFVGYARDNLLESFHVPSASMLPTIVPGDHLLADKRVNRPSGVPVWRGAVALFIYPDQRTQMYIKRIVALPGDRVEIDGTTISVNGRPLGRREVHDLGDPARNRLLADHVAFEERADRGPYTVLWKKDGVREKSNWVVPSGSVFVLGDNRDGSRDSRQFGVVPLADVKAVARQVFMSYAPDEGMRWSRLGHIVR